jgi:hypothetical protein
MKYTLGGGNKTSNSFKSELVLLKLTHTYIYRLALKTESVKKGRKHF